MILEDQDITQKALSLYNVLINFVEFALAISKFN